MLREHGTDLEARYQSKEDCDQGRAERVGFWAYRTGPTGLAESAGIYLGFSLDESRVNVPGIALSYHEAYVRKQQSADRHEQDRDIVCPGCGATFESAQGLRLHQTRWCKKDPAA